MSPCVEKYIDDLRAEIASLKKAEKDAKLRNLNLIEEHKEYVAPGTKAPGNAFGFSFYKKEIVDGEERVYTTVKKPAEISDEEYSLLCELIAERDHLKNASAKPEPSDPPFQIEMRSGTDSSHAATFLKLIAWFLWIGGIVLAFMLSATETRSGTEIDWTIFLTTALTYALYGALSMCASELFRNLQSILNALLSIKFKKNQNNW